MSNDFIGVVTILIGVLGTLMICFPQKSREAGYVSVPAAVIATLLNAILVVGGLRLMGM